MNEQLKLLTCGSVDDGKSTLIGHLLYDSKLLYIDQKKTLILDSKIKSGEDIDYSLLLDGLDEEREQGITIDVSYRYFNTKKRSFIVLDTPGHEEYTRNMAVAASQSDLAILLIDSTKGILKQTKRHLNICMMMGIKDYIVVVNKMDLINYNKEIFYELEKIIKKYFNEYDYSSLYIIPISAKKGDNISSYSKNMKWYNNEYLLNYLENVIIKRNVSTKFIMPVQRVCRPNQHFRGYQGNVFSGNICVGDKIICYPSKEVANIKELYNLDKKVKKVKSDNAVTIILDKEIDVSRGCVLSNDYDINVTNNINVKMLWMDEENLKLNHAYYFNIGTFSTLCYIKKINYIIDIENDKIKKRVTKISKNDIFNCDIELLEKTSITKFDKNKTLGSFILINRITNLTSSCGIVENILENNLYYHNGIITPEFRKKRLHQNPITIWFTGLSCSGKSTIANELDKILNLNGYHTSLLDGDNIRLGINKDLTFSNKDRIENIRRVSEIAKLMNESGLICITAFITPLEINRDMAKNILKDKFCLVYIDMPIEECEKRDTKGLYKKARKGEIKDFTGISAPFEKPSNADIVLKNTNYKECAQIIYNYIKEKISI